MSYLSCLENVTKYQETKKILEDKKLIVKEYDDYNLFLVKYNKSTCDMNDPDVQKCRGLIMEKNTNKLICVPPIKSEKIDNFLKEIELNNITIEEFPDGTMINVFKYNDAIFISTRSSIGANCKWYSDKTFNILFKESINLDKFGFLEENMCLSFVLQHPENIIVTKYSKPSVTLVKIVKIIDSYNVNELNNTDIEDFIITNNLNLKTPKTYNIENKEEINNILNNMTNNQQGLILKSFNNTYRRSKIRNSNYDNLKKLKGNTNNKKYLYLELRNNNTLDTYLKYFEEDYELFNIYKIELYSVTTTLFNFYQNYYVRKNIKKFLDIDYEYRPLCNELHSNYINDKTIITKPFVIKYINNLPIAKLLFVINYKYREQNKIN